MSEANNLRPVNLRNKFRVFDNREGRYLTEEELNNIVLAPTGHLYHFNEWGDLDHGYEENRMEIEWCIGLKDKNDKPIYDQDIFDIHQTVNGCNLFKVVWDDIGWRAEYAVKMNKPRLYEYDLKELFDVNYEEKYPYEVEIEVVGTSHDKDYLKGE